MKSSMKWMSILAFSFFCLSACTFGDKGSEGRMDSTKVDTSKRPGMSVGTGTGSAAPAMGKDTTMKDSVQADSTSKTKS